MVFKIILSHMLLFLLHFYLIWRENGMKYFMKRFHKTLLTTCGIHRYVGLTCCEKMVLSNRSRKMFLKNRLIKKVDLMKITVEPR